MKLSELEKPIFIVSKKRAEKNIDKCIKKSKDTGTWLRPHFKTHQSAEISELFKSKGINKIAVSNMDMANYFIKEGFKDICLAIPLNPNLTDQINKIGNDIEITVFVESTDLIKHLIKKIRRSISIMIKTDTGYGRTGIKHNNTEAFEKIIQLISTDKRIKFKGFAVHNGHSYQSKSEEEVKMIHNDSRDKLSALKKRFSEYNPLISMGDTPSVCISDDFNDVDEIRPGNFVYFDLMQYHIGSCNYEDIACIVAAPVIATHYERNEIVVHAGAVHMSKESLETGDNNHFGEIVKYNENIFFETENYKSYLKRLSQEHGIISISQSYKNKLKAGDIVFIIPVHSCLTANLMKNDTVFI